MITGLLLMVGVAGLLLVGMLMARLRAVDQTLQLKRHRSKQPAVCDLLNYAALVGDGVVIGKNGALIAGWEYAGDDYAGVTDIERDMVSVRINQALARLGSGY
jgi:type IV secretion system protein VirB4